MDAMQLLNQAPIKAVLFGHFMLIAWALLVPWLPSSYLFYNTIFLITLMWSLHQKDSHEPVLIALVINLLSIVLDAISIGLRFSDGHTMSWFAFSALMAIANLLLRPVSSLVLFKIYNERSGRYSSFGFPGLGNLGSSPNSGGPNSIIGGTGRGAYENIDAPVPHQSVPSPIHDVESNIPPKATY